jgi:hypothetical protein
MRQVVTSLLRLAGGAAIVAASFYGTLLAIDYMGGALSTDAIRVNNAKAVMVALKSFRSDKNAYPVLAVPDSRIKELAGPLVGGGYIAAVPVDPSDAEATHYVSYDGKAFGLWLHQKSGPCLVEVGASKTGWWGQPPPCKL